MFPIPKGHGQENRKNKFYTSKNFFQKFALYVYLTLKLPLNFKASAKDAFFVSETQVMKML